MPHDIHPFAVMFWEGEHATTYMAENKERLLKWLENVSPQLEILDLVYDKVVCKDMFSTIGKLVDFIKTEDCSCEQLSFL